MSTFDAEEASTAALVNVQGRLETYCKKGALATLEGMGHDVEVGCCCCGCDFGCV